MTKKLSGVWAECCRPQTLDEMVLPSKLHKQFAEYIANKDIPSMLFVSPSPGTGKTTLAKILTKELNTDILFINGSKDNGMDVLRNTIETFVMTTSPRAMFSATPASKFKIVFIDEAEYLTVNAQSGLRNMIEQYEPTARFIFTANWSNKFIEPIMSRMVEIKFDYSHEDMKKIAGSFLERVGGILDDNNIQFEPSVLVKILKTRYPDFRKFWMDLQCIYDQTGSITEYRDISNDSIEQLITIMNTKSYSAVLDYLCKVPNFDYTSVYGEMFRRTSMLKFDLLKLTMLLARYQDLSTRANDKMLCYMALVAELCS